MGISYSIARVRKLERQVKSLYCQVKAIQEDLDNRRDAVINIVDGNAPPPTEVLGDRYIIEDQGNGVVHVDWDSTSYNSIVEFGATEWTEEIPIEGWVVYVDDENNDALFEDDGVPMWVLRTSTETDPIFTAHTVSSIVDGTGFLKNDGAGVWSYDTSVLVDGDFGSNGIMIRSGAGVYVTITDNSTNWNTAFGWGDHASGGYAELAAANTFTNVGINTFTGAVDLLGEQLLLGTVSGIRTDWGGVNSFYIGASGSASTTGANNLVWGDLAADALTTGEKNIVIGTSALSSSTAGTDIIAIGFQAVQSTTGLMTGGVFIGSGAGASTTSAFQTTAVGFQVIMSAGAVSNGAFFGFGVGRNVAGAKNTAMGWEAMGIGAATSDNVAIGYRAFYKLTVAQGVAVGTNAFTNTTTGNNNTGIGHEVGKTNITGIYNFYGGHRAGTLNTGSRNVFLGGLASDGATGSFDSITIGYGLELSTATADNELNIGGVIFGTGIYTGSSKIGIGIQAPSVELDLEGSFKLTGRILGAQGSDIASATNITLGNDGNYFDITGTTTTNTIASTDWTAGSSVVLQFDGALTFTHSGAGTGASVLLAGSVDFITTAGDTLTLSYDGTTWRETARTVI